MSELFVSLHEAGMQATVATLDKDGEMPLEAFPCLARLDIERLVHRPDAPPLDALRELLRGPAPIRGLAFALAKARRSRLARAAAIWSVGAVDVAHVQFAHLLGPVLRHRQAGLLRCRRIVCHLRGWDVTTYINQKSIEELRDIFSGVDLFIANCAHFADRARSLGCRDERLVVIGSPIDIERFRPPDDRSAASDTLRIAAVGRLVEKKGFSFLLEAMAILRSWGRSARLDIIGDGPQRAQLEELAASLRLEDRVSFHGAADQANVLALLHASDVFAACSVTAANGDQDAPVNTLKEAMATELPVVATRHGGIPELVEDGRSGFLAPERDAEAIAAALAKVADASEDGRRAMGRAGRAAVATNFTRKVVADRTIAAYEKALSSRSAS